MKMRDTMFTPTVDEASLKHTLVAYLESENYIELSKNYRAF